MEEKKALEITIKALKTSKFSSPIPKNEAAKNDTNTLSVSSRSESTSDLSEHSNSESVDYEKKSTKLLNKINETTYSSQEEKISALTSNIQLLIENKSKLESNFQAERKKLRVHQEKITKLVHLVLNLKFCFCRQIMKN